MRATAGAMALSSTPAYPNNQPRGAGVRRLWLDKGRSTSCCSSQPRRASATSSISAGKCASTCMPASPPDSGSAAPSCCVTAWRSAC